MSIPLCRVGEVWTAKSQVRAPITLRAPRGWDGEARRSVTMVRGEACCSPAENKSAPSRSSCLLSEGLLQSFWLKTIRNPAPPSHRTATSLNTLYPELYNGSSLGLPRPSSVLWTWWLTVGSLPKSPDSTSSSRFPLPSHGNAPPQPPGFRFSLADLLLCLACPSSQMSHLLWSLNFKPCKNESPFYSHAHRPLFNASWILLIFHPNLVHCLVYNN